MYPCKVRCSSTSAGNRRPLDQGATTKHVMRRHPWKYVCTPGATLWLQSAPGQQCATGGVVGCPAQGMVVSQTHSPRSYLLCTVWVPHSITLLGFTNVTFLGTYVEGARGATHSPHRLQVAMSPVYPPKAWPWNQLVTHARAANQAFEHQASLTHTNWLDTLDV
jgi:hypothetical protein